MQTIHEVKCNTEYFQRVATGQKRFEIRKNDRDYQVGDILHMYEFYPDEKQTTNWGSMIPVKIVYMTSYKQLPGYVVLGIELLGEEDGFNS